RRRRDRAAPDASNADRCARDVADQAGTPSSPKAREHSALIRLAVAAAAVAAAAVALAASASAATPRPLLVGFEDEPSFLWASDRLAMLDRAAAAHTSLIRVIANWHDIAPTRPRNPTDPADPAYHFEGFDDLVWQSGLRGIRVLLTVWGTPRWASASHKL